MSDFFYEFMAFIACIVIMFITIVEIGSCTVDKAMQHGDHHRVTVYSGGQVVKTYITDGEICGKSFYSNGQHITVEGEVIVENLGGAK